MAVDAYALTSLTNLKSYLNIGVTTWDTLLELCINAASARVEAYIDRKIMTRTWTEVHDPRGGDRIVLRCKPVTAVYSVGFGVRPCLSFGLDSTANIIDATFSVTPDTAGGVAGVTLKTYSATATATTTLSSSQKSASALVTALNNTPWVVALVGDDVRSEWMHQCGATDVKRGTGYATCPMRFDGNVRVDMQEGVIHRTPLWSADAGSEWNDDEDLPDGWHPSFGSGPQSVTVVYVAGEGTIPYDLEMTTQKVAGLMFRERSRDQGVSSESLGDYAYVNAGAAAVQSILEEELSHRKRVR